MEIRKISFLLREVSIALIMAVLLPTTVYRGVVAVISKPENVVQAEKERSDLWMQRHELNMKRSDLRQANKNVDELDKQIADLDQKTKANSDVINAWQSHRDFIFFIASAIIGVLSLLAGLLVEIPLLGTGLILGGGFTLVAGYITYWNYLSDIVIFASLCVALLMLIAAFFWYSRKKWY